MDRDRVRATVGNRVATSSGTATVKGLRVSGAGALARVAAVMGGRVKAADPSAGDKIRFSPPVAGSP